MRKGWYFILEIGLSLSLPMTLWKKRKAESEYTLYLRRYVYQNTSGITHKLGKLKLFSQIKYQGPMFSEE